MEGQKERYAELDLIRFFAALSVVIYHYKSKYIESLGSEPVLAQSIYAVTKFGYLGVDLFFIISGFVIFASALGRTGFQFAVSRITRIYPTLWVCVSITALISLLLRGQESGITVWQWLANMTLFNKKLGVEDIDGVYWTLFVELKFYFCILVLLLIDWVRHYRFWIPLWLLATITFLFFKQPFFLGWFISPEYSSYFISGIIFYLARRDGWQLFHAAVLLPSLLVSSVYAHRTISTFARDVTEFDRLAAVAIVWALYLLFFLVSIRKFTLRGSSLVLGLGGMTYPLYLLHNRTGKELYDALAASVPPLALVIGITALMLLASWAIHVYLERGIADRLKFYLFSMANRVSALRARTP
ncbi:MAG: acyltransferase [Betaproteobacteria bacterium]|nr:acyltransferase [Betaproteobacteria bacterium]